MSAASFPAPYSVDIALSARSHERIGGRRTDDAWLAERWADPATRVLVLAGGRFPLGDDGTAVRWLAPAEAPEGERLLLGERDGVVHFVVLTRGFRAPDDWGMLRSRRAVAVAAGRRARGPGAGARRVAPRAPVLPAVRRRAGGQRRRLRAARASPAGGSSSRAPTRR